MKIMVIADTHRQINRAKKILEAVPDITNVIHLGDMVSDAEDLQELFPNKVFCKVRGNNDRNSFARDSVMLNMCGHNIFATHGHAFGVKSGYGLLAQRAREMGCDLALFGHTHTYTDTVIAGVRCLNPSSKGYFLITENSIEFFEY